VHSAADERRNQHLELSISNQRIAAHKRKMKRFQAIDNLQHTIDKSLPFSVMQTSERDLTSKVLIIVRVAPGTAKRAFFRDFDGERGLFALQYLSPRFDDFEGLQRLSFLEQECPGCSEA
jgi:hypothetical protein